MWRINSVEEITTTTTEEYSDEDEYNDLPALESDITTTKVPFPEAGIDFIDAEVDHLDNEDHRLDIAIKCTDLQNWEQNWLFRKKKKTDCKSEVMLGYMAMILSEIPVCMLIPNPIDKLRISVGDRDIDELSELSEHNSFGSLEFSEDEIQEEEPIESNCVAVKQVTNEKTVKVNGDSDRVATNKRALMKTTSDASNECNEPKAMRSAVVGSDHKNKPNVKLFAKVPNFMPKELRDKDVSAQSDPHLVLIPGDASVQSGILVQFCCRAKGTKPLSFSWFKNDTILKSDQNYRIFQSGEENVLEIKRTSVEDSAQYSCVAFNPFGYHWCDFALEVKPEFNANKMPISKRKIKSDIPSKPKGVFSTNPKHETHKTHKTRPLVVQRTWAERVAELKIINSRSQCDRKAIDEEEEQRDNNRDNENNTPEPQLPLTPTIAIRQHQKWETPDIEWKDNNPYSIENLNSRRKRRSLLLSMEEESPEPIIEEAAEEDDQVDTSFLSSKSKDLSRYKKDYYIKNNKDETLRSFDENVYSNSKYFDLSQSKQSFAEDSAKTISNGVESQSNLSEPLESQSNGDSLQNMPSVKDLVNKFATKEDNDNVPKLVDVKRKSSFSDSKLNICNNNSHNTNGSNNPKNATTWLNNHSHFKVHSLTARSLTKEFREMSQLNLPRTQRNRMDIYSQNHSNSLNESESSNPSTPCSPTNEGYASDESNTSSVVSSGAPPVPPPVLNNKTDNDRKFSKSILRRASYWEKRCEKGLISDSSVSEDFPPMEKFAN